MMALIRTIFAVLIAVSVAVPPAISEVAMSTSPAEVMTIDQADMPCCPGCDKPDASKSMACILKCVMLTGLIVPLAGAAQPSLRDGLLLSFVHDTLHGFARTPPTHPPSA